MTINITATPTNNKNRISLYNMTYTGAGTIWTFWDGNPPDLVLRCIESMRKQNPNRPVVVVSKATLPLFLDANDYPTFNGCLGTPDDFSSPQYLSDWVRLTLLEKFGGIWFDASVICTSAVESWISQDDSKITMFPMHANSNVHGNWTMASPTPGHPLIKAWRNELARVLNEAGPRQVPTAFCKQAFVEYPALNDLWNKPSPPPLPYLWVYLVLQVVLQQQPKLHETIDLKPSIDGPMYRRYLYNVQQGVVDSAELSNCVAQDLATEPISRSQHDRYFIKLVGMDRAPCQSRLDAGNFVQGSALCYVSSLFPRPIAYGCNLQDSVADALVTFRAAVYCVMAAQELAATTQTTTQHVVQASSNTLVKVQRRASQTLSVPSL